MKVHDLRFVKPLPFLAFLFAIVFANSLLAQDQDQFQKAIEGNIELQQPLRLDASRLPNLSFEWKPDATEDAFSFYEFSEERQQAADEIDYSLVSKFWIGVQVEKAGSSSFSPKELPDTELSINGGLKILSVSESGAAVEAGLKENDVLLKFANEQMNSINDLFAAVGKAEDNEADLVLIRNNELITLRITPQPRPEEKEKTEQGQVPTTGLWTLDLEEAYRNELKEQQLPEGYQLTIDLVRGENIIFTVKKGSSTWKTGEDAIDQLPEPVQSFAKNLAAQCKPLVEKDPNPLVLKGWVKPGEALPIMVTPYANRFHFESTVLRSIENQLREMKESIEKLKLDRE